MARDVPPPHSQADWVGAVRVRTLPAAVVPVVVGLAVASRGGRVDAVVAAATLLAAMLIQIGTNLANDYSDFVAGADTVDRLGPARLTQSGAVAPEIVWRAALGVLGAAAVVGVFLVARGGWPILALGIASILCAVAYTGGPWPLGYHGLGDLFVFVFFGVVAVTGTVWLQRHTLEPLALLASLPVGCLATAILVVNNLRDIPTDRRAGKCTLAVRIGDRATRVEYVVLVAGAFVGLAPLVAAGARGAALAFVALPLAVMEVRRLLAGEGKELNRSLSGTARLHLVFGLLLAIGLAA